MYGSLVLSQPGALLTSVACVPPKATWKPGVQAAICGFMGSEGRGTDRAMLVWVAFAATWGPSVVQAQAAAEGYVWVHGPTLPESELTSGTSSTTKGRVVAYGLFSHSGHNDTSAMVTAGSHIWFWSPTVASVWIDVCDSCCYQWPC